MKIPDEEISNEVALKLIERKCCNIETVNKIATWVKDGTITTTDLLFLLENQRPDNAEISK